MSSGDDAEIVEKSPSASPAKNDEGSPSPVKKPASISNYLIKGAQLTQFTDLMAKWVYRVKRGNVVELQVQVASATQRRNFWASKASGMFPLMEQRDR